MFLRLLCICLTLSVALASWRTNYPKRSQQFDEWKGTFEKTYSSEVEEAKRFLTWLKHVVEIEEHNKSEFSWTRDVNKFADQTPEEFNSWANGLKYDANAERTGEVYGSNLRIDESALPASVDWRKKGVVNAVKNQQQCGSCWAFSTIVSLEGQYALKNSLKSFSEQDLVDCVKGVNGCCNGCSGGLMDPAFQYLESKQNGNDDLESNYKYTAANGQCEFKKDGPGYGGVTGHVDVTSGDLTALKHAVATIGPISVGVDASKGWQTYGGGVYTPILPGILGCSSNPAKLDHGVAVVGYETTGAKPYWIIRNSWGATWGEEGYMYLAMDGKNNCGVANAASYPTLGKSEPEITTVNLIANE